MRSIVGKLIQRRVCHMTAIPLSRYSNNMYLPLLSSRRLLCTSETKNVKNEVKVTEGVSPTDPIPQSNKVIDDLNAHDHMPNLSNSADIPTVDVHSPLPNNIPIPPPHAPPGTPHHASTLESITTAAHTLTSNTKYYTDVASSLLNKHYMNIEETLLKRISDSNRRNIRIVLSSIIIGIILITVLFGSKIRKKVTNSTADIAKETLENESLKIQTQELAMAVVHTILTDKEVTIQAANFLREASQTPETQSALLMLLTHVIQHPDSLTEMQVLVQKVLVLLSNDPVTKSTLVSLFTSILHDPVLNQSIKQFIMNICNDESLNTVIKEMLVSLMMLPEVNMATTSIVTQSSKDLLMNQEVMEYSREFISAVVGDATIQKESGAALYNSITHALTPGFIRILGVGVVMASIGFIEIILSNY